MGRKVFSAALLSMLMVLFVQGLQAQKVDAEGRQLIEAPFTATAPTLDGVLSPGEWSAAASNSVDFTALGVAGNSGPGVADDPEDISYTFYIQYDQQYVYVAVSVKDDVYVASNYGRRLQWDLPVTWENDAVEYFFDGDLSRTAETNRNETETETGGQWIHSLGAEDTALPFISPELYGNKERPFGTGADAVWFAQTKVDAGTSDWVQEARFQLSILGSPTAGSEIGFNIGVDDVDTFDEQSMEEEYYAEVRDIQLYWTIFEYGPGEIATENTHENESLWGTLRFLQATDIGNWSLF